MSRRRQDCSEFSFWRKKDLRCTAHTTISWKFQVISMQKKKKRGGCYHFTTVERKANEPKRLTKKSDLVAAPNTPTTRGSQTRLNWPWFRERAPFSTGSSFTFLRNLILIINPSTKMGGGGGIRHTKHDQLSFSPTQPFLHPTVQLVTQIHWKLPWSHNSTSGLQSLGIREDYTEGRGACVFQQCACFLPLLPCHF